MNYKEVYIRDSNISSESRPRDGENIKSSNRKKSDFLVPVYFGVDVEFEFGGDVT